MTSPMKNNTSEIMIYAKAKMRHVHMIKSSKVIVNQFCNVEHNKENENIRINTPDELIDGEEYNSAVVGTKKGISIKK
jgi:hypothetical protein